MPIFNSCRLDCQRPRWFMVGGGCACLLKVAGLAEDQAIPVRMWVGNSSKSAGEWIPATDLQGNPYVLTKAECLLLIKVPGCYKIDVSEIPLSTGIADTETPCVIVDKTDVDKCELETMGEGPLPPDLQALCDKLEELIDLQCPGFVPLDDTIMVDDCKQQVFFHKGSVAYPKGAYWYNPQTSDMEPIDMANESRDYVASAEDASKFNYTFELIQDGDGVATTAEAHFDAVLAAGSVVVPVTKADGTVINVVPAFDTAEQFVVDAKSCAQFLLDGTTPVTVPYVTTEDDAGNLRNVDPYKELGDGDAPLTRPVGGCTTTYGCGCFSMNKSQIEAAADGDTIGADGNVVSEG